MRRLKNKKYAVILSLALSLLLMTGCGKEASAETETTTQPPTPSVVVNDGTLIDSDTFTVAIHPDSTDFISEMEDGKIEGFEIDLVNLIGEITMKEVKFVELKNRGMYADLDNSAFDCVISAVVINDDLDKVYDFSIPYFSFEDENGDTVEYAILVKAGNNRLLNVINHSIVLMKEEGTYAKLINKWFPEENTESSEESSEN